QLSANIVEACRQYQQEVRQGAFPAAEHCFNMNAELLAGLLDD
ncbi:MAG TPA: 3-methyl-2-oxobutanoate hydroxymethyltransferase, partial [Firmicutes bacterium]|nr:3-methyl-2-oxobutanoate hydroxymethyltransferase [Bacillota bacterium]